MDIVKLLLPLQHFSHENSDSLNLRNSKRSAFSLEGRNKCNILNFRDFNFFLSYQLEFILFLVVTLYFLFKFYQMFIFEVRFVSFDMNLSLLSRRHRACNIFTLTSVLAPILFVCSFYLYISCPFLILLVLNCELEIFSCYFYRILHLLRFFAFMTKTFLSFSLLICEKSVYFVLFSVIHFVSCYPYDTYSLWFILLRILLSADVHKNPGPCSEFSSTFFSFCNWNLNSLSRDNFRRISLLEAHNTNFNYDIISLCETSLNDSLKVEENSLPGYQFVSLDNPSGSRNGGGGMFYKESLPLKIRHDLSFDECLVSEIRFGRKKIFFSVIYRNPIHKATSQEFENFILNFRNLASNISNENPYSMFFTGDFNAHCKSWYPEGDSNAEGFQLDNLFSSLNLSQLISEPTHFFRNDCTPSCIDLIITDQPNLVLDSGVRPSLDPLVKHQITFCKMNYRISSPPKFQRKVWHFKRANVTAIKRAISSFPWHQKLASLPDPNDQVQLLTETILNIMSNFVPNEMKKFGSREPEWFNRNIKSLMRKQNKLYKKYKRNGFRSADKTSLETVKLECSSAISFAHETYLKQRGEKLADPTTAKKTYWKILNKFLNKSNIPRIPPLLVNNKFITNCKEKAKIFNEYFVSQCTPFNNCSSLPAFDFITDQRLSDIGVSSAEIIEIISKLDTNKSHGHDNLSVQMIKICGEDLAVPLKIIFDNILSTSIFPDQWKKAHVTPVHKKDDKQIVTNYRPISLLPIFAKMFEKIVFKNLYNYLIDNNLISKYQSGFRPGDSCTNQLIALVNDIHVAFNDENCLEIRSVYLDMSKAFDKVWHEGLIFKLKQNGINGKLLKLLTNYLNKRKQRVVINGFESEWDDIKSGVPQGSVLGPLLFLIYVNDLEQDIISSIRFFADDTSIFSIVNDPIKTAENLNHDLNVISKWATQWKMSFNPDPDKPAEEVIFSKKRSKTNHPPLFFNNKLVKQVESHKHLGLILDSKLNFNKHINEKVAIARKWIGIIKKLSPYLPLNSLDQIYKMHIRPHLDYCDIIFHAPSSLTNFNLSLNFSMGILERTQYQAALAITGAWQGTNRDKVYEELGWESLDSRRQCHRLIMFYKIVNNMTPEYLKAPIPMRIRQSSRISRIPNLPCRTNTFIDSFYPDCINCWNNLDLEIKNSISLSVFKKKIFNITRPKRREMYQILDRKGTKWIYQLRVGLSPLKSHKFRHNFQDLHNDICTCSLRSESSLHFFLECTNYDVIRQDLLNEVIPILSSKNIPFDNEILLRILLYGHDDLNHHDNKNILLASIEYVKKSCRFDKM